MKKILLTLAMGMTLVGCDNKTEGQKAADSAKAAVKDATQATQHATEAAKEKLNGATQATKDAAETAKEKIEEKK